MNEAQTIDAMLGFIGLTNQLFFGYVSLLSGFIVMSYLVADKISTFLATIGLVLFTIVTGLLLLGIFLSRNSAEHLLGYLSKQAQSGENELVWFGANPVWVGEVMTALYILAMFGGYFASIIYFFYSRKRPRSSS